VASVGERVTFSSPDENARAGETAPKFQCQPTLATPLVMGWFLTIHKHMSHHFLQMLLQFYLLH